MKWLYVIVGVILIMTVGSVIERFQGSMHTQSVQIIHSGVQP